MSAALFHPLDVFLHPVRAGFLHLVRDVGVDFQGERRRGVTEVSLDRLDVIPGLNGCDRISVPLRYNNGKPENPSNDGRFEGLSHLFHSFSNHEKAGQKS